MDETQSNRLSARDAAYIYADERGLPMHLGGLFIYEGHLSYERFVEHKAAQVHRISRYLHRLQHVPLNLAHPVWVDAQHFNIRDHIRRVTLPDPGTEGQLLDLVAELYSRPMDLSGPLWSYDLIEGLEGDRTALLQQVHHSIVDGMNGMGQIAATLSLSPEDKPEPDPPRWSPAAVPGSLDLILGALDANATNLGAFLGALGRSFRSPRRRVRQIRHAVRTLTKTSPWLMKPPPRSPFSRSLSAARRMALVDLPWEDLRRIRAALGGTVTHVYVAAIAGALRRYLLAHHEDLSAPEPQALIPVDMRSANDPDALNRVSGLVVPLPIGVERPEDRLRIVGERITKLRDEDQPAVLELFTKLMSYAPAPLHALAGGMLQARQPYNLICSSVPGPNIPLYTIGHRMLHLYPLVPLSKDVGLSIGAVGYHEHLHVAIVCDPQVVPDVGQLGHYIHDAFDELVAISEAATTTVVRDIGTPQPERTEVAAGAD